MILYELKNYAKQTKRNIIQRAFSNLAFSVDPLFPVAPADSADFAGSLFLFALFMVTDACGVSFARAVSRGLAFNPFGNGSAFVLVVIAILLSAYLIYRFDLYFLKRAGLPEGQSKTSALRLAVVTAPYLFLLPSEILYRGW